MTERLTSLSMTSSNKQASDKPEMPPIGVSKMEEFLLFRVDDRMMGVSLKDVEYVLRATYVTPLPETPPTVLGLVNVRGHMTLVLDIRQHMGLSPRKTHLNDRLILLNVDNHVIGFLSDEVIGVHKLSSVQWICPEELNYSGLSECFLGATEWDGDTLLLFDHLSLFGPTIRQHSVSDSIHSSHGDSR